MEAQIKEETKETSLCFESSGDNLASLSLVERYDRFLQNDNNEADSDGEFYPDDSVLREDFAQLRNDTANYSDQNRKNTRLSTGLPCRYANLSVTDDDPTNEDSDDNSKSSIERNEKSGLIGLSELIEQLELVRRCGEDGNSVFCNETELEAIQEKYGKILDFVYDKSSTFEKTSGSKDLTSQQDEEQDGELRNHDEQREEDIEILAEKMEQVQRARDRFYEVEQQVREQIEQLELVERYKMESVGYSS